MITRVLFVCHGNICRSPMAEFVMKHLVREAGMEGRVEIASAATSREEIGNDIHPGTKQKLREMHIPFEKRHARQITKADYEYYDYIIGMDHYNLRNMTYILGEDREDKISLLYQFAGVNKDIADPWYTGNFDETYKDVEIGCKALLKEIKER